MDDQLPGQQEDSARRREDEEGAADTTDSPTPEEEERVPFDEEAAPATPSSQDEGGEAPEEGREPAAAEELPEPVEPAETFEEPETFEAPAAETPSESPMEEEPEMPEMAAEVEAPEGESAAEPPAPTPEFPAEEPPAGLLEEPPTEAAAVEPSPVEVPEAPPSAAPEAEEAPAAEAEPVEAGAEGDGEAAAADEEPAAVPEGPFTGPGDWYVIHCYAGYENKVKSNLQSRIHTMQMEDKIFDVVVPMEDVMEIKGGRKQVVQKKFLPGYVLVKMIYENDSWYVVRNTPGVTGFVSSGTGQKPTPVPRREIEKILVVKKEEAKPQFRLEFEEGDVVRIISGPFADFNGTIDEINVDQSKVKVMVNIFDRETPVELSFDQVARV